MKASLEGLRVHHSIAYSRQTLGFEFSTDGGRRRSRAPFTRSCAPSRARAAVRSTSRRTPRRSSTGRCPDGRLFLRDLIEHATQPQFVYRHSWRVGDLVIWDNRATMHRGRAYDDTKYRRELRRVTTLDVEPAGHLAQRS